MARDDIEIPPSGLVHTDLAAQVVGVKAGTIRQWKNRGHLKPAAAEAPQEPPYRLAMRRRHPRPLHLAGRSIESLGGDLPTMLVKSHYDRHTGPPQAPRLNTCADHLRLS